VEIPLACETRQEQDPNQYSLQEPHFISCERT
jgi:hypothetical protein